MNLELRQKDWEAKDSGFENNSEEQNGSEFGEDEYINEQGNRVRDNRQQPHGEGTDV